MAGWDVMLECRLCGKYVCGPPAIPHRRRAEAWKPKNKPRCPHCNIGKTSDRRLWWKRLPVLPALDTSHLEVPNPYGRRGKPKPHDSPHG